MPIHSTASLIAVLFVLSGAVEAVLGDEVPRKAPVGRYQKLWAQSPFTEKPPPPELEEQPSELDDYTLAGVSPLEGGYSVVLINKKERNKRVHLLPGMANKEGFQVIGVRQDPISSKNTTVEIKTAAGKVGRVGYEEKYLALKAPNTAPAAKPAGKPTGKSPPTPSRSGSNRGAQQIPGLTAPKRPTTGSSGERKPRVRRVPTPPTNR